MDARQVWRDYSIEVSAIGIFGALTLFFIAESMTGNFPGAWLSFFLVYDAFAALVLILAAFLLRKRKRSTELTATPGEGRDARTR